MGMGWIERDCPQCDGTGLYKLTESDKSKDGLAVDMTNGVELTDIVSCETVIPKKLNYEELRASKRAK